MSVAWSWVETAAHLCNAEMSLILRREGEVYRLAANFGFSPEYEAFLKGVSISPGRGTVTARVALEGRVVHVEDITTDPEIRLTGIVQPRKGSNYLGRAALAAKYADRRDRSLAPTRGAFH
jgi:hypothetical protein